MNEIKRTIWIQIYPDGIKVFHSEEDAKNSLTNDVIEIRTLVFSTHLKELIVCCKAEKPTYIPTGHEDDRFSKEVRIKFNQRHLNY